MTTVTAAPDSRRRALRSLVADNPLLAVIAVLGFYVSYQTMAGLAAAHHEPGNPVIYPVLIDAGILAMTVEARKATGDGRSDLVPRLIAWVLTGFTIYVNAHGSSSSDWLGIALHVVGPGLWVTFLEITRWRKLRRRRAMETDRIPRSRWLLSPLRTFRMRRRMILHHVTSYPVAVRREEALLAGIALAEDTWGGRWRREAPALLAHHLRTGTLPADVETACEAGSGVAEAAEAWVTGAAERRAKVTARTRAVEGTSSPADAPARPAARPARKAPAKSETGGGSGALAEAALRDDPSLTWVQVHEQTGASKKTVERARKRLRLDGIVFPGDPGYRGVSVRPLALAPAEEVA